MSEKGEMSKVVAEEYASSLSDLVANSKPLINMLTMLAEENIDHAPAIVQAVEKHLQKVRSEIKLPVLYLIDSIVKNVGQAYTSLFTQNIVSTFCSVFEKVDERTRAQMFKLRQTWIEVFPPKKLYAMDVRVNSIDPAWPITAPVPTSIPSIHINPKFFPKAPMPAVTVVPNPAAPVDDPQAITEAKMREQLLKKKKKLLELQQKKLELELLQTKAILVEQQKQLDRQTDHLQVQQLLAPTQQVGGQEATKLFSAPMLDSSGSAVPVMSEVPTVKESVVSPTPLPVQVPSSTLVVPSTSAGASSRSQNKHKNDNKSRSTPKLVSTVASVRSRDPRLATRQTMQQQPNVAPDHTHATPIPPVQENTNTVFESVKLETAKPKPHITINIANKGNVNKETQGVSKKDPRLIRNKVHVSNSKERTTGSAGSGGTDKLVKSRGPSPSSPSRSGKSLPSLRKGSSKGNNASNCKTPQSRVLSTSIIDLTDSPPHKVAEKKEGDSSNNKDKECHTEAVSKSSSSSSKVDNHKKRSPVSSSSNNSSSSSRQSPSEKKKGSGKSNESGMGGTSQKRGKSPIGGNRNSRESSKKYNMFELEVDSPSPPPPPVISENKKKEDATFKEVKVSKKGRNYVRRNRREESQSPDTAVAATGDVDLRHGAPPEKHPRLTAFPSEPDPVVSAPEEESKMVADTLVDAATKDVDLRQLPRSPCKKRPSVERNEQPPHKKTKAEMIDALFGNEDVDLRQLAPMPVVTQSAAPPSPPPPPIISQPSPTPTTTSSQDSSTNTLSSPKPSSSCDRDRENGGEIAADPIKAQEKGHLNENGDNKLFPRGWEKYKESRPDIYKSPYRTHDLPKSQDTLPRSESPVGDMYPSPRDRSIPHFNRRSLGIGARTEFDGLGRPLLYHRLPADPGERRLSLSIMNPESSPLGEDTDMRPHLIDSEGTEHVDLSIQVIIAQAEEQLRNGSMTFTQYNTLLQQVIHLNEIHKLREAQRRDEQENKDGWDPNLPRQASEMDKVSPRSQDEDSRGNSPTGTRFGDIDERFPVLNVRGTTAAVPSPEPQPPGTNSLTAGAVSQWNELGAHHTRSGLWDQSPHPWLRGAGTGGITPGSLAPHIRMLHQGSFHRQQGPSQEIQIGSSNYGVINRWRPPQFSNRPSFEGELESRFDRFGIRFPHVPATQASQATPTSQAHQQPAVQSHQQSSQAQSQSQTQAQSQTTQQQQQQGTNCELPPADPMLLDLIAQDTMRTINIDGVPREIRYYGDVAIVLLAWDDPREIGFQGGSRRVSFDDRDTVLCAFNDSYRDFVLEGTTHRIRLGAPTRELYIDGKWYECFFGGPPVPVEMGGKLRMVKLEGPPPQVKIGCFKRTDLVAGKINLIINARNMVPIFLDAKPQRFDIENKPHVLRFTHALTNVVINGRSFPVEFGGLPKPIVVREKKHFIRFSVLPRGVQPGYINIVNMEGGRLPSPPNPDAENNDGVSFSPAPAATEDLSNDETKFGKGHEPVLPMLGQSGRGRGQRRGFSTERESPQDEQARSSPGQYQSESTLLAQGGTTQQNQQRLRSSTQLPLEMLTSLMPVSMAPSCGFSYQVEQDSQDSQPKTAQESAPSASNPALDAADAAGGRPAGPLGMIPFLLPEINVDELYKKLVASGIVPQTETATMEEKKEDESNAIKPVDFSQPETLKLRQPGLVAALYSGIQCSSCGVRFPPEQTMKYSQHLDWHFRQNRRDRDNTRKAQSRKWYYDISDWIQFEEIEDLEERAQSWFETQQAAEGRAEEKEPVEIPSVPAGENAEDTFCDVCHDKFEQFYNEEREEWHLRYAIRVDGKTYHPLCYEDHKASLEVSLEEAVPTEEPKEDAKSDSNEAEEPTTDQAEIKVEDEKAEVKCEEEETAAAAVGDVMEQGGENEDGGVEMHDKPESAPEEVTIVEEIQTALDDVKLEQECQEEFNAEGMDTDETINSMKLEAGDIEEEAAIAPVVDTTHTEVACSIDGNVKFEDSPQIAIAAPLGGKIKINITKPLPIIKEPQNETDAETSATEGETDTECKPLASEGPSETGENVSDKAPEREIMEPPPPGVEPMYVKPKLVGRKLVDMPPVIKGTELSGLCTIM